MNVLRMTLVLSLLTATVHAGDIPAKQHFDEATTAYNLGEFRRAADEYKLAYKILHDPLILYNIAQAFRLAKDFEQALFFYKSYLRNLPNARNHADVTQRIATLELELARQREVASTPPNELVSGAKKRALEPTVTEPVAVETAPTPTAPTPTVVSLPPRPVPTPVYKKWWLWTSVVGVVVVGVGVGVGVALGSSSASNPPSSALGNQRLFGLSF